MNNLSEEEKKAMGILKYQLANRETDIYIPINYFAIETILNLIDKQQKEIEELRKDNQHQWDERCRITFDNTGLRKGLEEQKDLYEKLLNGYNERVKEIEELEAEVKRQGNVREIEEEFVEKNYISKDRIQEALGFEQDMAEILGTKGDMTEEQILSYIDTLVSENNRLEDIEDRKVQVAVDNIEKKRDKYWQEKIKSKIKELKKMKLTKGDIFFKMRNYAILILRDLLGE